MRRRQSSVFTCPSLAEKIHDLSTALVAQLYQVIRRITISSVAHEAIFFLNHAVTSTHSHGFVVGSFISHSWSHLIHHLPVHPLTPSPPRIHTQVFHNLPKFHYIQDSLFFCKAPSIFSCSRLHLHASLFAHINVFINQFATNTVSV